MYNTANINELKDYLVLQGESIAVAESVTAGHLQIALSLGENASQYFQGGITTYNIGQKARHLYVDPISAAACNCVSQKTANEMAVGASVLFSSDWAIGITGYATPMPEWGVHDPYAFYGISYRGQIIHGGKLEGVGTDLTNNQVFYVDRVIESLLSLVPVEHSQIIMRK